MKVKSLKDDYEKSMVFREEDRKERLLIICNDIYAYCVKNIENKIPLPYCVDSSVMTSKDDMEVIVNMLRDEYLIESSFLYWNLYIDEFL